MTLDEQLGIGLAAAQATLAGTTTRRIIVALVDEQGQARFIYRWLSRDQVLEVFGAFIQTVAHEPELASYLCSSCGGACP